MIKNIIFILWLIAFCIGLYNLNKEFIIPWLIKKTTKEVEKNPKWLIQKLREQYYGFNDIDIILCESWLTNLPRMDVINDKKKRYQLLITTDINTDDIEIIGRLALASKVFIKYGLFFPEKQTYWLSILCYMLDGGSIKESDAHWVAKEKDKKQVDF